MPTIRRLSADYGWVGGSFYPVLGVANLSNISNLDIPVLDISTADVSRHDTPEPPVPRRRLQMSRPLHINGEGPRRPSSAFLCPGVYPYTINRQSATESLLGPSPLIPPFIGPASPERGLGGSLLRRRPPGPVAGTPRARGPGTGLQAVTRAKEKPGPLCSRPGGSGGIIASDAHRRKG